MNKQELKELLAARNDDVQTFMTWQLEKRGGHANAIRFALDLIDQLDEPEQVVCAENERTTQLVEVPQFVADWIEGIKSGEIPTVATGGDDLIFEICQQFYEETLPKELRNWFEHNVNSHVFYNAVLYGYAIEPPKTLQVIVKNYDSTVYKTELPEDEAMKLIEGWKG